MKRDFIKEVIDDGETIFVYASNIDTIYLNKYCGQRIDGSLQYNLLHRINGPAFESGWLLSWWKNGKRHREDGLAMIFLQDKSSCQYYLDGINHSRESFLYVQRDRVVYINEQPYLIDGRPIVLEK